MDTNHGNPRRLSYKIMEWSGYFEAEWLGEFFSRKCH